MKIEGFDTELEPFKSYKKKWSYKKIYQVIKKASKKEFLSCGNLFFVSGIYYAKHVLKLMPTININFRQDNLKEDHGLYFYDENRGYMKWKRIPCEIPYSQNFSLFPIKEEYLIKFPSDIKNKKYIDWYEFVTGILLGQKIKNIIILKDKFTQLSPILNEVVSSYTTYN